MNTRPTNPLPETAGSIAEPLNLFCDLATGSPFSASHRGGVPQAVLCHYGTRPFHRFALKPETWNTGRIVAEKAVSIIRSDCSETAHGLNWNDIVISDGDGVFFHLEDKKLATYSGTLEGARTAAHAFREAFAEKSKSTEGCYNLITNQYSIDTEQVPLREGIELKRDEMNLFYGEGFSDWSDKHLGYLADSVGGLCILEGPPGTGKTSYIRHMMQRLKETHRFYFIPPSISNVLSDPELIGFWAREKERHKDMRFVCVLEDAEGVLMNRKSDNRREVGAILNITDGLMADFLNIHLVCSINCSSTEIDPALLRPGRLVAHRVFQRRPAESARAIAAKFGRELEPREDYSLAEIFNETVKASGGGEARRVGFAV